MKARTANRAVRTYKEKQSKNIQCINIITSKLSLLGLDGTLQEKVKSADNFNL